MKKRRIVQWWMLSLAFCFPALYPAEPNSSPVHHSDGYPGPHLIKIGGGLRLNFVCVGSGSPTVVFEQGSGGNILDWRKVRAPVAVFTRTCFYDRAGFGYSDASRRPTTAINVTDDLHALLRASRTKGPIVLVGHSLGGLFATLYADRFRSEIGGLVLVDPSFAGQFDYPLSNPGKRVVRDDQTKFIASLRRCAGLAKDGELSETDTHRCFEFAPNISPDERRYLANQYTHPAYYEARISEAQNFLPVRNWTSIDGVEEKEYSRRFGDMPIEVLTADVSQPNPRKSVADNGSFARSWKLGHKELATRSTRGEHLVVARASHTIQFERPEAVILAIRKVTLELRNPGAR